MLGVKPVNIYGWPITAGGINFCGELFVTPHSSVSFFYYCVQGDVTFIKDSVFPPILKILEIMKNLIHLLHMYF